PLMGHTGLTAVEPPFPVSERPSLRDHGFGQSASHTPAAKLRAKIKTLHLANSGFQFMQSHATGLLTLVFSQQQPAIRRGVVSRKSRKFLVEALKAQAEAERFSILAKKFTHLSNLARRFRLPQGKSGISHAVFP